MSDIFIVKKKIQGVREYEKKKKKNWTEESPGDLTDKRTHI